MAKAGDGYAQLLLRQAQMERERKERKERKATRHEESHLQRQCVAWFRLQYPKLARLLFAVPNGGGRSKVEAGIMKAEGVTAGVSDLILLVPRGGHGALCIEMKTDSRGSRQSEAQKVWQKDVESQGYMYVVVRTLDEFMKVVRHYLSLPC